jgi:PAS domain S-box-containing protein
MGRTFDRSVMAGALLVSALLVVNAAVAYHNTRQLNEDARWVAHTHEMQDLTDAVMLALVDAETGERGFLLTGQDEYLRPFELAVPRLHERLARLAPGIADNPEQLDRVRKLQTMAAARVALLEARIDFRRRNAADPGAPAAAAEGKRQMDAIRALVADVKRDEFGLLRDREVRSRRAYSVAVTTGLLTAGLGLAAVGAFVALVGRSLSARQSAAAELHRQREWLRVTLASIGDGVIVTDTSGRIVLVNAAAARLTGWTEADARGRALDKVFRIVDEFSRKPADNPVQVVLREGTVVGLGNHTVLLARDGVERPVDNSAAPIRDERGNTLGVVLTFRDVTERKRADAALRESEQRFARFMQHLPGLAWAKDLRGRYAYVNDAAEKAFRVPRAELYGMTDDDVFPPETAAQFTANDRLALASETGVRVIETLQQADGVVHHSVVSKFPIPGPDGAPALVGGMAIDITDLKRAEEALKEADRRKDEFLAMLAHELRNPLAPIANALEVMRLSGPGDAAARSRQVMERQVGHLVRLVDDLLDVSRVMRGKIGLRREPVELAAVVARAVETARPVVDAEGHELTVNLPPEPLWLDGDLVRLCQVVGNLLTNAAKYTDRGGHIRVSAERDGAEAVLRVRDNGIGIAPDVLPRIFDMFVQAERRTRDGRGGLGIGLTLVRRLVELHGGSVSAHSEGPGKGSEFVVRLPLLSHAVRPGMPGAGAPARPAARPARRRVLVVDDSADAAESLALVLRLRGHDVRVAYDGASALELAAADPPDVALLDIGMPEMDGCELARRFRASPSLRNVVLAAVTGWGQAEDRRRTREAGFDRHFVKPVEAETLDELLAGLRANGA